MSSTFYNTYSDKMSWSWYNMTLNGCERSTITSFSLTVTDPTAMNRLGTRLGQLCRGGETVYLTGQLGAGKTTLTQAIGHALGVTSIITSPTFIMMNEYEAHDQLDFIHADLYRATGLDDIISIGLLDRLNQRDAVVVVEWPENSQDMELQPHLHLTITRTGDQSRQIQGDLHGQNEANKRLFVQLSSRNSAKEQG